MTYNDITYCSRECANIECKRNQKHLPQGAKYISMAEFKDCRSYNREKMLSEADEMFEELGYKKKEPDSISKTITYKSEDTVIDFMLSIQYVGISHIVSARELKAINKKCQELGWE